MTLFVSQGQVVQMNLKKLLPLDREMGDSHLPFHSHQPFMERCTKKQNLVCNNLFVDAWSLDKTWSEEQLRSEILMLFKDHIKTVNE
jgi:hypothetical protein